MSNSEEVVTTDDAPIAPTPKKRGRPLGCVDKTPRAKALKEMAPESKPKRARLKKALVGEPISEPIAEPNEEPVVEPVVEPVEEPVVEPEPNKKSSGQEGS